MRRTRYFIAGMALGLIASFCLAYVAGVVLENAGIRLFDSESDQQRNFNLFVLFSCAVSVICGWLAQRRA